MQQKTAIAAQRLVNLYRQHHVILGGWAALNQIFVNDATDDVMDALNSLPAGAMLRQHIESLRAGKTPMDSIEPNLAPYGGTMTTTAPVTQLSNADLDELRRALDEFSPNADGLKKIQSIAAVKKFSDEWQVGIKSALAHIPDLAQKWDAVVRTDRAYELWHIASTMLSSPMSERSRAEIQAELPEFETYLPMFGDAGRDLLRRLREFVSSV